MIDPSQKTGKPVVTELPRPAVEELTTEEAASVRGGGVSGKLAQHADEAPKETVTFEYGGLSVEYKPQKPDGSLDP